MSYIKHMSDIFESMDLNIPTQLNIFYKYFITEHVQLYIPFWLNIFFWMTVAFRQSYGFKS